MRSDILAAEPERGARLRSSAHHRETAPRSPAGAAFGLHSRPEYRLGRVASELKWPEQMRCF